jgi:asparagine synthase (glutamine-hydrolysing)
MLKRLGINNVTCISYGRKGSREAIISKQVAKALGYDWLFVEYKNKKWYECYHSKEADSFREYAGNFSSLPHMQDFLAIRELKNHGSIPENSVFVPGHTGDMLSGSHIPRYYLDKSENYTQNTFLKDSLKKHYSLWKFPNDCGLEQVFIEKILKTAVGVEIKDNSTCASAVELFDFNERQAKFIVNSVRVYEFFGYEWRIPFWDAELINFFLKVPIEQRVDQVLYRKYARNWLFSEDLSVLKNIDCTTDILDLRPLEKRSKYEKFLYYKKFIHSYYDEKVNNPIWGRYFKNPVTSRLLAKITRYENKDVEEYPLLRMILEYRNEKKYNLTINGISSLEYLTGIIRENYSSGDKIISMPVSFSAKKRLELVNMKIGKK